MSRPLTQEEKDFIDQNPNLSSRKVADELDRSKSTINDYRARVRASEEGKEDPQDLSDEILEDYCNSEDYDLANLANRLRTSQRTNNQLRRIHRGGVDTTAHFEDMIKAVNLATKSINTNRVYKNPMTTKYKGKEKTVMEVLFSDF